MPLQHAQEQPQHPIGRQPPCSQLHQRRFGQPGRQLYVREGSPPLVNLEGQFSGMVDYNVGH